MTAEPVTPPAPGPERTTRPPAQFAENPALGDIHFNFDKWDIRPRDAGILNAHAAWLKKHPGIVVLIEGHCDERGTNEYNMALGDRRANAARDYLQAHGIAADRMSVVSYGEERPLCREHTTACWAKNRRGRFLTKSE